MVFVCLVHKCKHQVTLQAGDSKVSGTYISECVGYKDHGLYGFDLLFSNPVSVTGMVELTILIRGSKSYFGVNGKEDVKVGDISVRFTDLWPSSLSNGTNTRQGQIYEVILSAAHL